MEQERKDPLSWLLGVAGKLLPPATPQPEDRESIWSIYRRDARTFFRLVSLLWLVALAYISYKTLNAPEPNGKWRRPRPGGRVLAISPLPCCMISAALASELLYWQCC